MRSVTVKDISVLLQKMKKDILVTESTDLRKETSMDSLDLVEFVMMVEDEFDVEISDEDVTNTKSVGELIALLNGK